MENIFYAALALNIAGKPVNKQNLRAVLVAASTPIDECELDGVAAFIESLQSGTRFESELFEPGVTKFLTSGLAQRSVRAEYLEGLLDELSRYASAAEVSSFQAIDNMKGGPSEPNSNKETMGRYVYGIVPNHRTAGFSPIGINNSPVHMICHKDICALVHDCLPRPYESNESDTIKTWVESHHRIVDSARKHFGTVIPMTFDTIMRPKNDETSPNQVVIDWLEDDYEKLGSIIQEIHGSAEYGIQIFYSSATAEKQVAEVSDTLKRIKAEIATMSPGIAYLHKQKLQKVLRSETEGLAKEWLKTFQARIERHCRSIVVESNKKLAGGVEMLLNVSCLVSERGVERLGKELEEIDNSEGFSVKFSGPWPPYSFVSGSLLKGDNK